jgi:hypothetical protein
MNYKLTLNPECVFRIEDSTYITKSEFNSSWTAYEKWIAEGNEPLPAVEPPVVPAPEPEVTLEPEVVPAPEQETPAP